MRRVLFILAFLLLLGCYTDVERGAVTPASEMAETANRDAAILARDAERLYPLYYRAVHRWWMDYCAAFHEMESRYYCSTDTFEGGVRE